MEWNFDRGINESIDYWEAVLGHKVVFRLICTKQSEVGHSRYLGLAHCEYSYTYSDSQLAWNSVIDKFYRRLPIFGLRFRVGLSSYVIPSRGGFVIEREILLPLNGTNIYILKNE